MKALLIILALFSSIALAQAETRYIVDQAKLPLRSGQGTSFSIVRMLPSGAAVQVLEKSKAGYTRVRTSRGKEGWILSRFLMKSPAARDRLAWAEKELSKLNRLQQEKKSLEQVRKQLSSDNNKLQQELAHIRKTAANAVIIADENRALQAKANQAEQAYDDLRQETKDIRNGAQQRWFMLGGGAILLGILLGLILPRLKFRRKDRWSRY